MPFAIGLAETVPWRRNVIWGLQVVGLFVGLYLLYLLIGFPLIAIAAENVVYVSAHFYKLPVMDLYLTATCVSCFFSSDGTIRLFGALALAFFGVAELFFSVALFSVWCFFAAMLSAIIYIQFKFRRTSQARRFDAAT